MFSNEFENKEIKHYIEELKRNSTDPMVEIPLDRYESAENHLRGTFRDNHEACLCLSYEGDDKGFKYTKANMDNVAGKSIASSNCIDIFCHYGLTMKGMGIQQDGIMPDVKEELNMHDIIGIPGLWLTVEHPELRTRSRYDDLLCELHCLEIFPLKPTTIVDNGDGITAFWGFNEIFWMETPEKRFSVMLNLFRLQSVFAKANRFSRTIIRDTSNLAHKFRPVGTSNHRFEVPRVVRFVKNPINHDESAYYSVERVLEAIDECECAGQWTEGERKGDIY